MIIHVNNKKLKAEYSKWCELHRINMTYDVWLERMLVKERRKVKSLKKKLEKPKEVIKEPKKQKEPEFIILQIDAIKGGIIGSYSSITQASNITGISRPTISRYISGHRKNNSKYIWKKVKTGCLRNFKESICPNCPQYAGKLKCKLFEI